MIKFLLTLIGIHFTGALLWFIFYMMNMFTNPKERAKFQHLVQYGSSKEFPPNVISMILILVAFGTCLLKWEVSAYKTVKKSYKNFLPKNK